jgi:hypothetical protein
LLQEALFLRTDRLFTGIGRRHLQVFIVCRDTMPDLAGVRISRLDPTQAIQRS